MKVLLEDAINLQYCRRGCREFAQVHGLDWETFRREGLDASVFEGIDDEMCRAFLAEARRREAMTNGNG